MLGTFVRQRLPRHTEPDGGGKWVTPCRHDPPHQRGKRHHYPCARLLLQITFATQATAESLRTSTFPPFHPSPPPFVHLNRRGTAGAGTSYLGTVVDVKPDRVKVHYTGWHKRHDTWLPRARVRRPPFAAGHHVHAKPRTTFAANKKFAGWKGTYKVLVPWYDATVLETRLPAPGSAEASAVGPGLQHVEKHMMVAKRRVAHSYMYGLIAHHCSAIPFFVCVTGRDGRGAWPF